MKVINALLLAASIAFSLPLRSAILADDEVVSALADTYAMDSDAARIKLTELESSSSIGLKSLVYVRLADISPRTYKFTLPFFLPGPNDDKCNYAVAAYRNDTNNIQAIYVCMVDCDPMNWSPVLSAVAPSNSLPHYIAAARLLKQNDQRFVTEIIRGNILGLPTQYPVSELLAVQYGVKFEKKHERGLVSETLDTHSFLSVLHSGLGIGLSEDSQIQDEDRAVIRAGMSMNFLLSSKNGSAMQLEAAFASQKWLDRVKSLDKNDTEAEGVKKARNDAHLLLDILIYNVKNTNAPRLVRPIIESLSTNATIQALNRSILGKFKDP